MRPRRSLAAAIMSVVGLFGWAAPASAARSVDTQAVSLLDPSYVFVPRVQIACPTPGGYDMIQDLATGGWLGDVVVNTYARKKGSSSGSVTATIDFHAVSAGTYQALISEVTLSPEGQVTNCAWDFSVPFIVKKVSLKKPTLAPVTVTKSLSPGTHLLQVTVSRYDSVYDVYAATKFVTVTVPS